MIEWMDGLGKLAILAFVLSNMIAMGLSLRLAQIIAMLVLLLSTGTLLARHNMARASVT